MKPVVTLSFDDGDPRDLRIAELLARHALKATFYVPITNVEGRDTLSPEEIRRLDSLGFEIGAHGYHHHYLDAIPPAEVYEEIRSGRDRLEKILGKRVPCFCYPGGKTPPAAVDAVRRLGFDYARTIEECRFTASADPLLTPTTNPIGRHCRRHYVKVALLTRDLPYLGYFFGHHLWARNWFNYSLANLNYAMRTGGVCHLWGHAFEIDRDGEWERLERLFGHLGSLVKAGKLETRVNSESFHGR